MNLIFAVLTSVMLGPIDAPWLMPCAFASEPTNEATPAPVTEVPATQTAPAAEVAPAATQTPPAPEVTPTVPQMPVISPNKESSTVPVGVPTITAPATEAKAEGTTLSASDLFLNRMRARFENKEISYKQFRKILQDRLDREKKEKLPSARDVGFLLEVHTEALLSTKDDKQVKEASKLLFSLMSDPHFSAVNFEPSFDKLKYYFEIKNQRQEYLDFYHELAKSLKATDEARQKATGPLPLQTMEISLLLYVLREEFIGEEMKRLVDHPKLFEQAGPNQNIETINFIKIAALNMMGRYPEALELFNKAKIPSDVSATPRFLRHCRFYVEKVDLLIKSGRPEAAKNLSKSVESRAKKIYTPETESCLLGLYSTIAHLYIDREEYSLAEETIGKMKKIGSEYALGLTSFLIARLDRVTGKASTDDYLSEEKLSWSISTITNMYAHRQNFMNSIYLKDKEAFKANLAGIKEIFSKRWDNIRHENIFAAWERIGNVLLLDQFVPLSEIESFVSKSEDLLGKHYYPNIELRRFLKANAKLFKAQPTQETQPSN